MKHSRQKMWQRSPPCSPTYIHIGWESGSGRVSWKVLSNEKRGDLKVVAFDRPPFKLFNSRWDFQTNQCRPHPVRGLELLRKPCLYHLQSIIASKYRYSVGALWKKSVKLACHVVNSNIAIGSLPSLQTSHGLLAVFEKIYYGDPIFTVISNNGEDVQYRCYN